jgi:hypothetical protein
VCVIELRGVRYLRWCAAASGSPPPAAAAPGPALACASRALSFLFSARSFAGQAPLLVTRGRTHSLCADGLLERNA